MQSRLRLRLFHSLSAAGDQVEDKFQPIRINANSRLIVLSGKLQEQGDNAEHLYEFRDGKFLFVQARARLQIKITSTLKFYIKDYEGKIGIAPELKEAYEEAERKRDIPARTPAVLPERNPTGEYPSLQLSVPSM